VTGLARTAPRKTKRASRPVGQLKTVNQLASLLSVSRTTVYRLTDQGMPALRVGSFMRFDWPSVQAWLTDYTAAGRKLEWFDDYESIVEKNRGVARAEVYAARAEPIGVSVSRPKKPKDPERPYVRTARRINPAV
jgi:excisionase family DNA binding protein